MQGLVELTLWFVTQLLSLHLCVLSFNWFVFFFSSKWWKFVILLPVSIIWTLSSWNEAKIYAKISEKSHMFSSLAVSVCRILVFSCYILVYSFAIFFSTFAELEYFKVPLLLLDYLSSVDGGALAICEYFFLIWSICVGFYYDSAFLK